MLKLNMDKNEKVKKIYPLLLVFAHEVQMMESWVLDVSNKDKKQLIKNLKETAKKIYKVINE